MPYVPADQAYAQYGEAAWNMQMDESGNVLVPDAGTPQIDMFSDRWFGNNEGYYHPMDGGIYYNWGNDPEITKQIQSLYPHAKLATAEQLKRLNTPDKAFFGGLGAALEKFGDAAGPGIVGLPFLLAAVTGALGAGAGAGALETAGAFGGEALGTAANTAGAFGGNVAPWTAGAGAATGGTNMSWFDDLLENFNGTEAGGDISIPSEALEKLGYQADGTGWIAPEKLNWDWLSPEVIQKMPGAVPETPAQLKEWGLIETSPGRWEMPAMPGSEMGLMDYIRKLPSNLTGAAQNALKLLKDGDNSAFGDLLKLGIPLSLLAGLFEDNKSPLVEPQTRAAFSALETADKFGALAPIPMMDSSKRAVDVANSSVGNWKPYVDEGAALTRKAAGGIPSVDLNQYMNPYMDAVMPGIRREAEKLKIGQNAAAGKVGAFGGTRMAVENSLADRNLLETTGKVRMSAFDNATGLASKDLDRMGNAGAAFTNMGSTVGKLATGDVSNLTQAGALERQPHEDKRQKLADTAKIYTGVIHGTAPAVEASTDPSKLTQAAGALGALNSLSKLGIA